MNIKKWYKDNSGHIGTMISILSLIFSGYIWYETGKATKNETISIVDNDFSKIRNTNSSYIQCLRYSSINKEACLQMINFENEDVYKKALQLNYERHSKFILNDMDYPDFKNFLNVINKLHSNNSKEDEIKILQEINTEINKLFDVLVDKESKL